MRSFIVFVIGCLFASSFSPGYAACETTTGEEIVRVQFQSKFLRREISGLFTYKEDYKDGLPRKYAKEAWGGQANVLSKTFGSPIADYSVSLSGEMVFSKTDFSSTTNKTLGGVGNEITNSMLFIFMGFTTALNENVLYNSAKIEPTSVTMKSEVSSSQIDYVRRNVSEYTLLTAGTLTETLSDEFTVEDAIVRAENVTPAVMGTSSLQYSNPYSMTKDAYNPQGVVQWRMPSGWRGGRDWPILFHAQRVGFRLELPARSCGGKVKLVLRFAEWPMNEQPTASAARVLVSPEMIELDPEERTFWPSAATFKSYEEFGLPMKQGFNQKLLSAEVVPISSCHDLGPGEGTFQLGSVRFDLSLGRVAGGEIAGELSLLASRIDSTLFTPKALQLTAHESVVPVRVDGRLRQVVAPEVIVDVVATSEVAFEIRSYRPSQAGTPDPVTGIRPISGEPFQKFTFSGDATTDPPRPSFTITPAANPGRAATYVYDSATDGMSMSQLGDERKESVVYTQPSTDRVVETRIIKNARGDVISQTATTFTDFTFGRRVTAVTRGVAPLQLTTTTSYYTDSNNASNFGRVREQREPSGAWTGYTYDGEGRVTAESRRYLNNGGTGATSHRVINTTYSTVADQDGDSVVESLVTRIETALGIEVARSYEFSFSAPTVVQGQSTKRTLLMRASVPGADRNASSNQVTVTHTIIAGVFKDKVASVLSPDGVLTTYSYATHPTTGAITTTIDSGVPNADATAVVDGTRSISITNSLGHLLEESKIDLATSTILEASVVTDRDASGRALRIDYTDGTFELRSYACCGLASETDRQGLTTTYAYDPLGRLERVVRPGSTTRYTYDAAGNRLKTIRIGSDGTEVVVAEDAYDTAGRLISAKDGHGRLTTYSTVTLSAGQQQTTLAADGGTRVETTAADGSLLKAEGSSVPWSTYSYTVNPDGGVSTTEYTPAVSISDTSMWRRSTLDYLGRLVSESFPGGAASTRSYNALGQLARQTDPDGVQTLFAYDAQGRLSVTALDVNRNGAVDYAGPDQIVRTKTFYTTRAGTPVLRNTTEVWETIGSDTPTTVSVTDTTLNGRETWRNERGLETHSVTSYSSIGDPTTVTTFPDGTVQTSVSLNGRLASTVVTHPAVGTFSSISYSYDAHGRVQSQTTLAGTTTYTYFADDQVETVTTPDPDPARSGPGYDPQVTRYRYDAAGRVDKITHPDGTETFTTYTPGGQVLRTWGSRTYPQAYTYDAQQRLKTLTTWQNFSSEAGAAVTTWNYHPQRGWLLNKRYTDGTGPSYTYTSAGRLRTRTWARTVAGAALTATYSYHDSGALSGIDYSDTTPDVAHTYDRLGRLLTTTDAAGVLTRSYENGRLDDEVYSGTGLLAGRSVARTQDGSQRLGSLTVSGVPVVDYAYDAASRLHRITQEQRVATQTYHSTRGYPQTLAIDHAGTSRLSATRTLDNLDRLTSIATGSVASFSYDYNAANQRVKASNGVDGSGWSYEYDSLGQVTSAIKREAGGTVRPGHTFGYTFDDIGNRKQAVANGLTAAYTADLKNQYTNRTTPPLLPVLGTAAVGSTVLVNHQPAAQREGKWFYHELALDAGSSAAYFRFPVSAKTTQGSPPTSELVRSEIREAYIPPSPEVYTHDADGNLTSDGRWSYIWDAENRLVSIETRSDMAAAAPGLPRVRLTFAYDAGGRRIGKTKYLWSTASQTWTPQGVFTFVYDGWNLIAEYDAAPGASPLRSYVWGLDLSGTLQGAGGVGGLLWATASEGTFAPAYDGNGNITAWIDVATGTKVAENDYDAFGNIIPVAGKNPAPFGFSTKLEDGETGLLYYGFRCYNTSTGRWLSRDPMEEQGGRNLNAFVKNNPISLIDSVGQLDFSPYGFGPIGPFNQGMFPTRPPSSTGLELLVSLDGIWRMLVDQLPRTPVSSFGRSGSGPVGFLGPTVVSLGYKITGKVQACCNSKGGAGMLFTGTIGLTVYNSLGVKTPEIGSWSDRPKSGISADALNNCETTLRDLEFIISGKVQIPGVSFTFPVGSFKVETGLVAKVKIPNIDVTIGGNLNIGVEGSLQREGQIAF